MRLVQAMLIGSAMTAISATAGVLTLPLLNHPAVASVQDAGADAHRWTPPEPTTRSLPPVPITGASTGVEGVPALLLGGIRP